MWKSVKCVAERVRTDWVTLHVLECGAVDINSLSAHKPGCVVFICHHRGSMGTVKKKNKKLLRGFPTSFLFYSLKQD